ncbi:hypothetical protein BWZ13_05590 [Lactobacillus iners]|uniref:Resolvase/invertase-type recombinase catalytic domain-containing protein n=1 Tax=Lactobacillus iners TaxID=147802 RepID=A0A6G7BAP6_9LACO|nr:hypothetical protein [Lactobacillus iners]CQB89926.1 Uncharacterised protein [Chlamydia trachomatis]EFQ50026.1 hypothetical protein HMPREF9218_0161 [Lactobacillus iners LEAF 2062A-h1]PMC28792.1 hypothetical protein CJ224_05545 [Lactobacillus iners]PNH16777.1 hypothetical protein BWZ13_05590 [Lactobacillus iners]QIH24399.1 hypothetical protein G6Z83_02205 [Lactobacillus iners]
MLDMMIQLMGFVAQNERYKIRERQMQGIKLLKQIYRIKKREELAKTQEETKNEIYKA